MKVINIEQKKFMDIERIKLGDDLSKCNIGAFEPGDIIQISEKWDGSNASVRYNIDANKLEAFSRKRQLDFQNTLNGFWNFVQTLDINKFACFPDYVIFGEWGNKNKINYRPECYKHWYIYDIFDVKINKYLPQSSVKAFCELNNLEYIHVLYEGEFISWDHCKSFCHSPAYGDTQEGIVVKNQTKLNDDNNRFPFYLKIVNEEFSEVMKHKPKEIDPIKEAEKARASEIVNSIVTRRRVEKELFKMRDEGIISERLESKDMKDVARLLPKRIYNDCIKEEIETAQAAGEYFGKMCSSCAMKHARNIILGG